MTYWRKRPCAGVVREALRKIVKSGLPGEHHFYIAFDTRYPGVRLSRTHGASAIRVK